MAASKTSPIGIVVSLLLTPLLLGLHYWTQHNAFLYLFGVVSVLLITVAVIAISGAVILFSQKPDSKSLRNLPPVAPWRLISSAVIQVGALSYLLWVESYVISSIYIVMIILTWILHAALKQLRKRAVEQEAAREENV